MLIIRLRRTGKKNKPSYRIVVAEHSFPIDGRFVEDLGFYNPHTKNTGLDKEKTLEWMKKGAKPSNSVAKILEAEKVKHGSVVVIKKSKKPKKTAEEKPAVMKAAQVEAPAEAKTEEASQDSADNSQVPAEPVAEETPAASPDTQGEPEQQPMAEEPVA
jgi:small subunit ribosomal protein S16